MIVQIKNIRFTYQSQSVNLSRPRKRVGNPGGSAAMRRPERVPLRLPQATSRNLHSISQEVAMPAMTALSFSAAVHVKRALNTLGARMARSLKRMADAVKNRHSATMLARLDDR